MKVSEVVFKLAKKAKKPFHVSDLAVGEIGSVDNYPDDVDDDTGDGCSYYLRVSTQGIVNLSEMTLAKPLDWHKDCELLTSGSLTITIDL